MLLTNINHFESPTFFVCDVFFGTLSVVHFRVVYCVNLLNIGLHNGESKKARLTDQVFEY